MARKRTPAKIQSSKEPKISRKTLLAEHRSLKALMVEAQPGEELEDVMRRKCRAMVAHAKKYNWDGPPFDPKDLASLYDIKVEETDEEFGSEGRIFPRRGKLIIQYRAGSTVERQRFTICHELAHTCFPDAFELVRNHGGDSNDDPAHKKFESLCDLGAAELLMPHEEFSVDAMSDSMCLKYMDVLRLRYISSIEATLGRMMNYTEHSCAAVFLTDEAFKDFPATDGRMRVQWMWKSKSFSTYLKPGTLAPKSDVLLNAPTVALPFSKARETWWINNQPRSWYVEAIKLPVISGLSAYAKVAALLHGRLPEKS